MAIKFREVQRPPTIPKKTAPTVKTKERRKEMEHEKWPTETVGSESTVLQIRVREELKDQFTEACKKNNTTPSTALREFMRTYVGEE